MKSIPLIVSLLILAILNVLPPLFIPHLAFNNAPEIYLPDDQPSVVLEKQLREMFPDDQVAIVLFKGNELYSDDFLTKLQQATRQIKNNEKIERVINVTEIEHISSTDDGFEVSPLLGKSNREKIKGADERFNFAISDNVAIGAVVSPAQDYMGIIIRPYQLDSTIERIALLNSVEQVFAQYDIAKYIVAMAGPIPLEIEQFNSMIRDTMTFVPGTMIIGLALIWLMFRRFLAVLVAGVVTGAVVNGTLMLFIVFDLPYTLVASMIPPLLAALTTAFIVHFYTNMQLASSFSYQAEKRVAFALAQVRRPAFFTAMTTAIGLCSLGVSPIPPISHFGIIAAAGVVLLLFLVMYVVPVIFVQFDRSVWPREKKKQAIVERTLRLFIHFSIRHSIWVVAIMSLLLISGLPFIAKVTAETNMLKFFPDTHKITTSTALIENKLTGVMPLEINLYGDKRDSFKQLGALQQVKLLQSWLAEQPEIDKVNSVVEIVEQMHQGFHENLPQYKKLPDNSALISQYFFIYDGIEVYELVNREFDQTRIVLSMNEHNSQHIRQFIQRINNYLSTHIKGLKWQVGGEGLIFAEQDSLLIQGQMMSLLVAIVLIFLMMLLLWQNLGYAILTMLPNLSPIVGIFILMGIFNIWLDMATAMIASVSIGIAVDDTIHMFHGFKKRLDKGCSVVFSLVQSYYKTGRAVVATTIILCSQFLLLAFSNFIPTAHFGLLTAIGLLMALLFDLLLLPALIILFYKKKKHLL